MDENYMLMSESTSGKIEETIKIDKNCEQTHCFVKD